MQDPDDIKLVAGGPFLEDAELLLLGWSFRDTAIQVEETAKDGDPLAEGLLVEVAKLVQAEHVARALGADFGD